MSHNSNHNDATRGDSVRSNKEQGSASYRLTSSDGWVLVSGEKRQNGVGYRSHTGTGYNTNFNKFDTDRSRFKRDDNRTEYRTEYRPSTRPDNKYVTTKNAWTDRDIFRKKIESSNSQYNEFRRDDSIKSDSYQKYQRATESSKDSITPLKTESVDPLHDKENDSVRDDDSGSEDSETLRKQKNDNYKKILCKNINNIGRCIYNNKCLYAHSLEEQNIEPIRLIAYNMIKKKDDLSHLDLSKSKHLYNHLQSLSKLCQHCDEGTCTGGYNCKHGACDKIYVICQTDLNKGTCEGACGKIHLTTKGLVPYGVSIVKNMKTKITIPKATVINEEFFKKLNQNITKTDSESIQKSVKHFAQRESEDDDSEIDMDLIHDDPDPEKSNDVVSHETNQNDCDENRWDSFVTAQDDVIVKKKKKSKKINNDDNDSLCSDDSEKMECVLNFFPVKTDGSDVDSFDDFKFDDVSKREEKLTKSIFRIDVMCI